MLLGNTSNHKSHHHPRHHHHGDSVKEFRVSFAAEEPIHVLECADPRRTKSEKMSRREATKEVDVDKEADEFIKFEHRKFCKWTTH
ncbi:unnamed protein product [Eruca vesicaria subsp. sativa]|uniref:Uncharacterized protein n=1 Tax=Eruca vesicaria subsp. sativa TaxID=29727 RepID=A0ABC8JZX4_ERUVS|nr:unnamed protein product [Eruca vesicaria subsp. sativa]